MNKMDDVAEKTLNIQAINETQSEVTSWDFHHLSRIGTLMHLRIYLVKPLPRVPM